MTDLIIERRDTCSHKDTTEVPTYYFSLSNGREDDGFFMFEARTDSGNHLERLRPTNAVQEAMLRRFPSIRVRALPALLSISEADLVMLELLVADRSSSRYVIVDDDDVDAV